MSYTSKVITVEKALSFVKSNSIIVTGLGAAEGGLFMEQLHTIAGSVENVKIVNCNPTHACDFYKEEYADTFTVDGWFYAPQMRKAHAQGNMAYIPNHLHLAATKWLYRNHPNIFVAAASMPDENGYISIGTSNTYERRVMEESAISEQSRELWRLVSGEGVPVKEAARRLGRAANTASKAKRRIEAMIAAMARMYAT